MTLLSSQQCIVCKKDSTPIKDTLISKYLLDIPQWQLHHEDDIQFLQRVYKVSNFASAILLTNQIAELAEEQGHHPAILTEWGKVTVRWWTHTIGGLHLNDFILAAKTEQLCT
ncbi:MAG: 4a-hydroxytetrahydrobiopterin dehydratase [Gammaproteobacteria bacterium]|nr:MAG: 4a-hydroxytetrahydrobiopterin dehydratase [Gammaproteobacteria bacterium]PHR84799.1 MAG: 4a-hydroxytetrahydrobiopterin dehydratase [Colwellia sp.]